MFPSISIVLSCIFSSICLNALIFIICMFAELEQVKIYTKGVVRWLIVFIYSN